jgi:PAS domain S-box-containing protein
MKKPPRPKRSRAPAPVARLKAANARLRQRLTEAEETLEAIRMGHVDALVVQGPTGEQVFTLKGADHRYRQLVETMNEGALMISATGTIVYGNARFAALVRVPLEAMIGSPLQAYVAPSSHEIVEAMLHHRSEGATKAEAELVASDGTRIPVYLSATASWDEIHQLTCIIATDLTDQKRNQDMVAAERLAARIVDQAAEGIVVCDLAGRVIRASDAAYRVSGVNPLLQPFEDVFHVVSEPDRPVSRTIIELALRGETINAHEVTLLREAKDPAVLLLSAGPITNSDGEPLGCVISFIDVTDRKRAAEERLQLLEGANDARIEAEMANRAKDEFLAMLGHEMRNPLAPILTAIELMNMKSDETSRRERDVIERQVKHVVRLVDDLLDVSRIAQGKVELERRAIDLADIVSKSIEVASPVIEERRHQLVVDVPGGLMLDGDEGRLCQVVSNLLTNAAKYTERGGRIEVRATSIADQLILIVRDNGMGVPPELLPNLFDLFVQGKRTLDRSEGGLGLGLSIVRSLVVLHGGTVTVRSDGVGQGSEFELTLPALVAAREVERPARTRTGPQDAVQPSRRVLIVDDNADAADLLADALAALGHETRVAYDGPSGLDAAAEFSPDIALLDIGLPVMDGYELAARLRSQAASPRLPRLIALTGYGQDSDRRKTTDAGFDSHMVKPIDLDALDSAIKRLA